VEHAAVVQRRGQVGDARFVTRFGTGVERIGAVAPQSHHAQRLVDGERSERGHQLAFVFGEERHVPVDHQRADDAYLAAGEVARDPRRRRGRQAPQLAGQLHHVERVTRMETLVLQPGVRRRVPGDLPKPQCVELADRHAQLRLVPVVSAHRSGERRLVSSNRSHE
jgi:hypothetical protein